MGTFHKSQREKEDEKGGKSKQEKGYLTGDIFLRPNKNYWDGVTLAQAATGQLLTQMGGNLQGSHSTDSLEWDSSLICMAQLGSMAQASLLKHIEFIKNFKKP